MRLGQYGVKCRECCVDVAWNNATYIHISVAREPIVDDSMTSNRRIITVVLYAFPSTNGPEHLRRSSLDKQGPFTTINLLVLWENPEMARSGSW